jgi:hypothetical protein
MAVYIVSYGSIYCILWQYILYLMAVYIAPYGSIYCILWQYILYLMSVYIAPYGSIYCILWQYILHLIFYLMAVYIVSYGSIYVYKLLILLVVGFTLLQVTKALRESKGIAVLCFLDLGTRRECGVSVTLRPLSTPGKDPVPILQETGWALGRHRQFCLQW